jgi:hypothetical protein
LYSNFEITLCFSIGIFISYIKQIDVFSYWWVSAINLSCNFSWELCSSLHNLDITPGVYCLDPHVYLWDFVCVCVLVCVCLCVWLICVVNFGKTFLRSCHATLLCVIFSYLLHILWEVLIIILERQMVVTKFTFPSNYNTLCANILWNLYFCERRGMRVDKNAIIPFSFYLFKMFCQCFPSYILRIWCCTKNRLKTMKRRQINLMGNF